MGLNTSLGLLLVACFAMLASLPLQSARAEPKAIDPLKVITFNIRYGTAKDGDNAWPKRRGPVCAMLAGQDPDILGLQECLDFQLDALKAALPGHDSYALGREADGGGEMCALLWRRERFELIDSGSFGLHPQQTLGSAAWDADLPRICSWLHLYDKLSQRSFWVYNAHFDHVGKQARLESAKLIEAVIAQRDAANGVPMPVLLLGDFNCTPDSPPVAKLSASLQDCYALGQTSYSADGQRLPLDESASGTFHDWTGEAGSQRIDYVVASADFSVLDSAILRDSYSDDAEEGAKVHYLSDHFPVMAELYFPD